MKSFRLWLSEQADTPKQAMQSAKEIEIGMIDNKAKKLYQEIIDAISSKKYQSAISYIDDIAKDPKLKFVLSLGFGGELADLDLTVEHKSIKVSDLIPTQNEIGFDETLKYILLGTNLENCFDDPVVIKKPIVTFNGKYIVDGHHRWSEIYISNPSATAECVNIVGKLQPLDLLKVVQCTIASNLGHLIIKNVQGKNLLKTSESELRKYISNNITDNAKEILLSKGIKDPIDYLVYNCINMQKNNKPIKNAPDRGDMPQTSEDPDLFNDLDSGVDDMQ